MWTTCGTPGGGRGAHHPAGALDVHPAQQFGLPAGLQRPGQVDDGVDAVQEPGEHRRSLRGVAEVGQVPPHAGVRSDRPAAAAGPARGPRPRRAGGGQPAQQRRPEVAAGAGDGDRDAAQQVAGEFSHAQPLPGAAAANRPAVNRRPTVLGMIRGAHVILYSTDPYGRPRLPPELLGLPSVDAGGGWLILHCLRRRSRCTRPRRPGRSSSTWSVTTSTRPWPN